MALREVLTNEILWIPVCAWAVAQMTKVFIILLRDKRLDLRFLVASGGMPSAHSAVVCALAVATAIKLGWNSAAFGITAILAMLVMYDAAGIRRSVSKQSIILDRILRDLREKHSRGDMERDVRELIGHTPFQVIIGAIMGILIAWLWLAISAA